MMILSAALALVSLISTPKSESPYTISLSSGQDISILAVGKMINGDYQCWLPDGKPSSEMTTLMRKCLDSRGNNSIRAILGNKNRVVLIQFKRPIPAFSLEDSQQRYLSYELANNSTDSIGYYMVFVSIDKFQTSINITLRTTTVSPTGELAFKLGQKLNVRDLSFELADVRPYSKGPLFPEHTPIQQEYNAFKNKLWYVSLSLSLPEGKPNTFSVVGLDKKGNVIEFNDGKLVNGNKDLIPNYVYSGINYPMYDTLRSNGAVWTTLSDYNNFWTLLTNVNPKNVDRIRILERITQRKTITGIAIDPSTDAQ